MTGLRALWWFVCALWRGGVIPSPRGTQCYYLPVLGQESVVRCYVPLLVPADERETVVIVSNVPGRAVSLPAGATLMYGAGIERGSLITAEPEKPISARKDNASGGTSGYFTGDTLIPIERMGDACRSEAGWGTIETHDDGLRVQWRIGYRPTDIISKPEKSNTHTPLPLFNHPIST